MIKIKRFFKTGFICFIAVMTLVTNVFAVNSISNVLSSGLKVHFISVGNGDCIYIECDGHNMLIDGGYYSDYHRDYTDTRGRYGTANSTDQYFFSELASSSSIPLPSNTLSGTSISDYIKSDYSNIKSALASRYDATTDHITAGQYAELTTTTTKTLSEEEKQTLSAKKEINTYPGYSTNLTYDVTAKNTVTVSRTENNSTVVDTYTLSSTTPTYSWTNIDDSTLTNQNNVLESLPSTTNTNKLSIKTKNTGTFKTVCTASYQYTYVNTKDASGNVINDVDNAPAIEILHKYDDSSYYTYKEEYDVVVNSVTTDVKTDAELAFLKNDVFKVNSNACTRYLDSLGITHIDYIINSHPHQDHAGGLISVLSKYSYNHFYTVDYNYYSCWASYLSLIGEYNENHADKSKGDYDMSTLPSQNSTWNVGNATLRVLSNISDNKGYYLNSNTYSQNSSTKTGSKLMEAAINNTSSIIRLDYGNNSFLFTGDSQVLKQNRTIDQVGTALKVQVLDIVHHGNSNNDFATYSDKSGDYAFYAYVYPSIAVAQCGDDHTTLSKPRPKVMNDLTMASIYTTRESGNIVLYSNGNGVSVSLFNGQNHNWYVSSKVAAKYHKDGYIKYICDTCGVSRTETLPMTHKEASTKTHVKATMTSTGIKGHYCACGYLISETVTNATVKKTIYRGRTSQLYSGDVSGTVTWKSSKKSVATVSKTGKVKAKKKGTATITMKVNGQKVATCKITVKNPYLYVSKSKVTLKKGKTTKISASVGPSATVKWSSSNKKVATVTSAGKITAKKKGTCKIRAKANGFTRTITVKVK